MIIWIICLELATVWLLRTLFARQFVLFFGRLLQSGEGGVWFYSIVTLPGVLVHEIAHFLTAALLGLRTGNIELLPVLGDSGGVEFGSVQVEKADPIRLTLVGLAPLMMGLPIVAWMSLQMSEQYFIWSYLIVCVTTHILPSKKDLHYWPVAMIAVGLLLWGGSQINNAYLMESVMRGLSIPLGVLAGGTAIFTGINLLISRRKIVQ